MLVKNSRRRICFSALESSVRKWSQITEPVKGHKPGAQFNCNSEFQNHSQNHSQNCNWIEPIPRMILRLEFGPYSWKDLHKLPVWESFPDWAFRNDFQNYSEISHGQFNCNSENDSENDSETRNFNWIVPQTSSHVVLLCKSGAYLLLVLRGNRDKLTHTCRKPSTKSSSLYFKPDDGRTHRACFRPLGAGRNRNLKWTVGWKIFPSVPNQFWY